MEEDENGPLEDETHLQQKSIFRFHVQSRVIPGTPNDGTPLF